MLMTNDLSGIFDITARFSYRILCAIGCERSLLSNTPLLLFEKMTTDTITHIFDNMTIWALW